MRREKGKKKRLFADTEHTFEDTPTSLHKQKHFNELIFSVDIYNCIFLST
jgi:hypothetical protein